MGRIAAVLAPLVFTGACATELPQGDVDDDLPGLRPLHSIAGLSTDTTMQREVREAFLHAWTGYREHAWGHDALRPLSRGFRDWYDVSLLMATGAVREPGNNPAEIGTLRAVH